MSASVSTASGLAATLSARKANSSYVAHLKIWESPTEPITSPNALAPSAANRATARKARYLILSVDQPGGAGIALHKAKRNANGSYSIGKDWDLRLLQAVQVYGPDSFSLTLSRTYRWQSERPRDQQSFLTTLVRVFRTHTRSDSLPHVIGLDMPDNSALTGSAPAPAPAPAASIPSSASPPPASSTPTSATTTSPALAFPSSGSSQVQSMPAASHYLNLAPDANGRRPSASSANSGASGHSSRTTSPLPAEQPTRNGTSPTPTFSTPAAGPTAGLLQRAKSRSGGASPSPAPLSLSPAPPVAAAPPSPSGPGYNQLFSQASPKLPPVADPTPAPVPTIDAPHDDLQDAYDAYDDGAYTAPAPASVSPRGDPAVLRSVSPSQPAPPSPQAVLSAASPAPDLPPRGPTRGERNLRRKMSVSQAMLGTSSTSPSADAPPVPTAVAAPPPPRPRSGSVTPTSFPAAQALTAAAPTAPSAVPEVMVSHTPSSQGEADTSFGTGNLPVPAPKGLSSRARLSSIEPARGGAAYERMLLAGTGMRDVGQALGETAEEDEEDEPTDDAFASLSSSVPQLERKLSVVSAPSTEESKPTEEEEEEDVTLLSVEEMLETYEWNQRAGLSALGSRERRESFLGNAGTSEMGLAKLGGPGVGAAEAIEASLKEELRAVDAANIHGMVESDDRVSHVESHIADALQGLEKLDHLILTFKVSLNARLDDISFVESQNRGLQVQMANQRQLADEISTLLDTVHVDSATTQALQYAPLDHAQGVSQAELAAAALYKSILQAMAMGHPSIDPEDDTSAGLGAGPRAMQAKVQEYLSLGDQFSSRVKGFITHVLDRQVRTLRTVQDRSRAEKIAAALQAINAKGTTEMMQDHASLESALEMYCGLLLFIKEAAPKVFSQFSAGYLAQVSDAYKADISSVFATIKTKVRKATEDELAEISFVSPGGSSNKANPAAGGGMLRSGTVRRMGTTMGIGRGERARSASRGGPTEGIPGGQAFQLLMSAALPIVQREQAFLADFLHINNNQITFADYMDLETFFRHQAEIAFGSQAHAQKGGLRNMHDALALCFGFFAQEAQSFAEYVVSVDRIQVVWILASLDRAVVEANASQNEFLAKSFGKLHTRLAAKLDQYVAQQIKAIEQTRLSAKKGTGVTHFVRTLPLFVERVEAPLSKQPPEASIRRAVDSYYEQISTACFDALQAMAKMSSANASLSAGNNAGLDQEDKGLLYSHIILIENARYLMRELGKRVDLGSLVLKAILQRAESMFTDALQSYVATVLRRPLGKLIDFVDGIELLLRSTPASEVTLHTQYARHAWKRIAKEYTTKELRKSVEVLSRRVQKHFGLGLDDEDSGPGLAPVEAMHGHTWNADLAEDVMAQAWRGAEEQTVKEVERFVKVLQEVWTDNSIAFELNRNEVHRIFGATPPSMKRR